MDDTYLDEVDYCLTLPRPKTKRVPVRDKAGWHLYFVTVPVDLPCTAIVLA